MADYYRMNEYSVEKLIEKYPMQNDINNILYDDFVYDNNGDVIPNSYTKRINEPMYFKKRKILLTIPLCLTSMDSLDIVNILLEYLDFTINPQRHTHTD